MIGALCGPKTLRAALNGNRELTVVDYGGWAYVGTQKQCRTALAHDCVENGEPFAADCIGVATQDDIRAAISHMAQTP
jgi:hypothetical protein